jgi:hypothetical protein
MTDTIKETFVDKLHGEAYKHVANAALNTGSDVWVEAAERVATLANTLYGEDMEGKRIFLAQVLGVQSVEAATEA